VPPAPTVIIGPNLGLLTMPTQSSIPGDAWAWTVTAGLAESAVTDP